MVLVLSKAFSFILALMAGYISKKTGFLKKDDYIVTQKIFITITLPASLEKRRSAANNLKKHHKFFVINN